MNEIRNKALEELLTTAEGLDWSYTIWNESEGTFGSERNYVELEKYSPEGEDFSMIIDFETENPVDSFLKDLKDYYEDFDPDEHAEMWIEARGRVSGVPNSIRTLIDDAEAIKEMIYELWDKLSDEVALPF